MPIDEIRRNKEEKVAKLKKLGIDPFPAVSGRDTEIRDALENFDSLAQDKKEITIAGRIMAKREHGGSLFADINDGSGKLQILLKEDVLGAEKYSLFNDYFDIGDFADFTGILFETKRGEKTLEAKDFKLLTKTLLPLPEKWHGLKDIEERLRKRYLDVIFNPEVREMVEKRAKFWSAFRKFMTDKGFLEVETPVLENTAGGADARPFITHHNALGIDVYLRISGGELWQKRLMVAGFEKTFEIGRIFRNEGIDDEHLQDYTQMEFYWAYADYKKGMKLVEEMYKYVARETFGTLEFDIRGHKVDLDKKWEIYDYTGTIKEMTGVNVLNVDSKQVEEKLRELKVEYKNEGFNLERAIDCLWKYCRKNIAGPGFLINAPVVISPLAKRLSDNPKLTQKFQIIIAGSEMGNGYSELNDPLDQAERFKEQQKLREAGDEEAQMYDKEFVEALEYGMPPTCGFGVSERLFSFLMNKPARECQIFPLMRPRDKEK
ncbi:MAG: lysyl-tRNA synthetase [Parcubacteria group bacterium Licking1014_17]|nr:MAG: lysyl-tRNA synthetase [Parcubacteria group bacterium Licking1014_17]